MAKYEFLKIKETENIREPNEYILDFPFGPNPYENPPNERRDYASYNYTVNLNGVGYYWSVSESVHQKIQALGLGKNARISVIRPKDGAYSFEVLNQGTASAPTRPSTNRSQVNATKGGNVNTRYNSYVEVLQAFMEVFDVVGHELREREIDDLECQRVIASSVFIECNRGGITIPLSKSGYRGDQTQGQGNTPSSSAAPSSQAVQSEPSRTNSGAIGIDNWKKFKDRVLADGILNASQVVMAVSHLLGEPVSKPQEISKAEADKVWRQYKEAKKLFKTGKVGKEIFLGKIEEDDAGEELFEDDDLPWDD